MRPPLSRPVERIEPDPRLAGSVRLIVGGRTLLTAPQAAVREEGVAVGTTLSEPVYRRLCEAADRDAAFRTAVRFLERRPFARRDLGRRLVLKGHSPLGVEGALDRAAEAGYLDDERFARHYVQTRSARGRGPARLRRELTAQGVAPATIERVLAQECPDAGSGEWIRALAAKRAAQLRELPRPDRVRRVLAFMARRGYRGPEVRRLVREVA